MAMTRRGGNIHLLGLVCDHHVSNRKNLKRKKNALLTLLLPPKETNDQQNNTLSMPSTSQMDDRDDMTGESVLPPLSSFDCQMLLPSLLEQQETRSSDLLLSHLVTSLLPDTTTASSFEMGRGVYVDFFLDAVLLLQLVKDAPSWLHLLGPAGCGDILDHMIKAL